MIISGSRLPKLEHMGSVLAVQYDVVKAKSLKKIIKSYSTFLFKNGFMSRKENHSNFFLHIAASETKSQGENFFLLIFNQRRRRRFWRKSSREIKKEKLEPRISIGSRNSVTFYPPRFFLWLKIASLVAKLQF